MSTILASTVSTDQEKFLSAKLISRTMLKLACAQACDKVAMPQGAGTTAYFVRYKRMNVPVATLTQGNDPSSSSFTVDGLNVSLDQWGDILEVSDVAVLATSHPIIQQAVELLSDNAQRVIDREIQIVWLAGTNIIYGDGSVTARASVTSGMKVTDALLHKARISLSDGGAPPRDGPSSNEANDAKQVGMLDSVRQGRHYLAICGPQVMGDVMSTNTSTLGTWVSVAMYANQKALYNAEVGTWLGFRWIETNFIPKFVLLGNTTAAVASAASFGTDTPVVTAVTTGGSLTSSTTFFYKVSKKDLLRGFEESISIAHSTASTATGNNESFTFDFTGLTAGFVYQVYFDTVTTGGTGTDATLGLVSANNAVGSVVTVTANPAATTTAPANIATSFSTGTVHIVWLHGAESCNFVSLQNLQSFIAQDISIPGNVLRLKRSMGYKFMAKTMIRDQAKMMRLEVATTN